MKASNLTITVRYRVTLGDIEIPDKVFNQLAEAYDNGSTLEPDMMKYPDASNWLSENIKESDCHDWECEVDEID